MSEPKSNALAAWERALDRGRYKVDGSIEAETCAERWPTYNAEEMCMQAAREALDDDDTVIEFDHFERAADKLGAVESDPGEPVGAMVTDGDVEFESLGADAERVDDLERRVDRLEAAILDGGNDER